MYINNKTLNYYILKEEYINKRYFLLRIFLALSNLNELYTLFKYI